MTCDTKREKKKKKKRGGEKTNRKTYDNEYRERRRQITDTRRTEHRNVILSSEIT